MNAQSFLKQSVRICLDVLFPPSAETLQVRSLTTERLLQFLSIRHIHNTYALLPFKEPLVQACVHEAKFSGNTHAQRLLAQVLADYLQKEVHIIPVPLSARRMRERGYNQVAAIARHTGYPIHEDILVRVRHTTPQTDLSRSERLHNLTDAFRVRKQSCPKIRGKHLILLDDVVTTGATLHAAEKALRRAQPASITCVALAH